MTTHRSASGALRLPRGWLRIALIFAAAPVLAVACATGVDTGGTGGSATTTTTTTGTPDAGGDAGFDVKPDVILECDDVEDCASLTGQCVSGACVNGTCTLLPKNDFGSCDDGLYCTENDVCQAGACVGGTAKFCPSQDSCHLGVCDEALETCKNVSGNDGADCDDGNACSYAGSCNSGICTQGPPVDCSIFDSQCTTGVCDPVLGCKAQPSNQGGPCNDGQGSPCSTGQCQTGVCSSIPTNENGPCDDLLFCTVTDKCTAGTCNGVPNTCAAPGDVCMIGSCNEATDTCIAVPGNDGAACNDDNSCTAGETCAAGVCVGGQPANEGVACDDDNGCTGGTICQVGTCTAATSVITSCLNNDDCCPAACNGVDDDCLYWQSGIQQNVAPATLVGWTQCYQDTFETFQGSMAQILAQCDKPKLLMGCKQQNAPTFKLLAMAPRVDVLFDCGQQQNCAHQANNVGWYYSDNYSWGFAPGGASVSRNSCDTGAQFPELRMCWHTGGGQINSGYRCGEDNQWYGPDWLRYVFEAD